MRNVKVVVGANFGDEGKGLMTDYFCNRFPKEERVLNVRFNGGAQAGHTVVSPDGRRHIFGHFGAGSFLPNVATYLGPDFIVNPILFRREYEKLRALGIYPMVYCHPRCIFTMPQDMMINQFLEKQRGNERHGSCGVGIFETVLRAKDYTRVTVGDVDLFRSGRFSIDLDYYSEERIKKITGYHLKEKEFELLNNQNIRAHFNDDFRFFMDHVVLCSETIFDRFDHVVFEGAQGLMLDQNNMDYFPHLTPSNTGIQNIVPYLDEDMMIEVCYVTRPYLTRHGAGYLPGECTREEVGAKIDLTNIDNEWQGSLRYGKLDLKDFCERCHKDFEKIPFHDKDNVAISAAATHLDEYTTKEDPYPTMATEYITGDREYAIEHFYSSFSNNYVSSGPMRLNVHSVQIWDDGLGMGH